MQRISTTVIGLVGERARACAQIASVGSGRWWPDLDRLFAGVDRVVPDQV
jgi:hypothetical protein